VPHHGFRRPLMSAEWSWSNLASIRACFVGFGILQQLVRSSRFDKGCAQCPGPRKALPWAAARVLLGLQGRSVHTRATDHQLIFHDLPAPEMKREIDCPCVASGSIFAQLAGRDRQGRVVGVVCILRSRMEPAGALLERAEPIAVGVDLQGSVLRGTAVLQEDQVRVRRR
jgi:hypothetical protein